MKKLLSFLFVVCTILTLFPGVSITASAVEPITDKIIQERINELDRLLCGKYFTVNGQGCRQWGSNHGCSNCNVNNIIKSQWFKNMFGNVQESQLFLNGGKSCMGFVEFAEWYIFRANNSDTVLRDSSVKYSNGFNYDTISKNAAMGDYIRVNGHSFILISVDTTGVEVLDCNSYSAYNCIVKRHRIEFSNKNYANKTIYISKLYSKMTGKPIRGTTQPISPPSNSTCIITFDPNGGNVSPTTQIIKKGGDPRNLPTPVREGYVFCGWVLEKIDADFTGTFSTASVTESSAYGFEEDTTIYALWQREKVQHIHEKINPIISPEHPHYIFYTCSCGEVFTDGTTTSQPDTCGTCFLAELGNKIEGIIPEPPREPTTYWTDWGPWSNTPVYPSDTREVETRQVKVSDGRTEYRYGGYVTYDGKHDCWCETYLRNKFGSATLRYSDWSTTRYSPNGKGWSCGFCGGNHIGVDRVGSDGRCWWAEYVLPDDSYYWEESRTTEATYETQYRYRDLISD